MPALPSRQALVAVALCASAVLSGAISASCQTPAATQATGAQAQFRKLAPGVEKIVPFSVDPNETHSSHDLVEVLATDPEWGQRPWTRGASPAKEHRFEHNVWGLDFAFKPVRFMWVDVPTSEGRMERTLVWYMVFRVKNPGDEAVRFVPELLLESWDVKKTYPDRQIPVAIPLIQSREDPNRRLLSTIDIAGDIPPSPPGQDLSIWGVAMWEGVDPRTDRFSVYVKGLTNAYQWVDDPSAVKAGDVPGTARKLLTRALQLNFWRPSDPFFEHEGEIRYGIPGEVDYRWVYR